MNKSPLLLIGALALAGCGHIVESFVGQSGPQVKGSGRLKTETRKIGNFTKVRSEGSVDIIATVGGKSDLKVTADDNLLKHIKTRIDGDTLIVSNEGSFSTKNKMEITFAAPSIRGVEVQGSSDIQVKGVKGGAFAAGISGSGDIVATGTASQLTVSIDGSGEANLSGLRASSATVSINGSGDIRVNASGRLDVSINGSGDVVYAGNPSITKAINGSGDVRRG